MVQEKLVNCFGFPIYFIDCVNNEVLSEGDSIEECCNNLISNHNSNVQPQCKYYNGSRFNSSSILKKVHEGKIKDIEDLKKFGKTNRTCPYFLSRTLVKSAHIVFCPYNYLLEPGIRKATSLDRYLKDALLILDEAHNVETVARDANSLEIFIDDLTNMQSQLNGYTNYGVPELYANYTMLEGLLKNLQLWCVSVWGNVRSRKLNNNSRTIKVSIFIEALATRMNISKDSLKQYLKAFKEIVKYSDKDKDNENPKKKKRKEKVDTITTYIRNFFEMFFTIVKYILKEKDSDDFAICVRSVSGKVQLNIWCLTAKLVFQDLRTKVKSIVLASGTLSPVEALKEELGINFEYIMEGSHIVPQQNLICVQQSFDDETNSLLSSNYTNSKNDSYIRRLGKTILEYLKVIPAGVLVFFPSFSFLNNCINIWKKPEGGRKSMIFEMNSVKKLYSESLLQTKTGASKLFKKKAPTLESALKDYDKGIKEKNGSAFFCVFRGRLSEGIDFKDDQCRAVIAVGIPFAPFKDSKIILKKAYQNTKEGNFNGQMWYSQQAWRAVNQALGRVIRHKNDYGALIFLDKRFEDKRNYLNLSKWIQKSYIRRATSKNALNKFFEDHQSKIIQQNKENQQVFANKRRSNFFTPKQVKRSATDVINLTDS